MVGQGARKQRDEKQREEKNRLKVHVWNSIWVKYMVTTDV